MKISLNSLRTLLVLLVFAQWGCSAENIFGNVGASGPSALSLSKSTLTAERDWTIVGIPVTLTVSTRDQYGEIFYDPSLTVTVSQLSGTSKGQLSSVTNNGDGTYTVVYTGSKKGSLAQFGVSLGGDNVTGSVDGVTVRTKRLAFAGNSALSAPVSNRMFSEVDAGFTITGNCDVELGNVIFDGAITLAGGLEVPCVAAGGGTFSIYVNHNTTEPFFAVPTQGATIVSIRQNGLKFINTTLYKTQSGTPPTVITNLAGLQSIVCNDASVFYIVANDIDVAVDFGNATNNWTPICSGTPFLGIFDGGSFTISNIHTTNAVAIKGFFGRLNPRQISNLDLDNITIHGTADVGAVAGIVSFSTAVHMKLNVTSASIQGTGDNVGGMFGRFAAFLFSSSFSGSVTTTGDYVGGIAGEATFANVFDITVSGVVSGGDYAGGALGYNPVFVQRVSVAANVTGTSFVGGIVGRGGASLCDYCFYSGTISASGMQIGGLYGYNNTHPRKSLMAGSVVGTGSPTQIGPLWGVVGVPPPAVIDTYYLDTTTCTLCDTPYVTSSKTDSELKTQSTYIGWDFEESVAIDEGVSYPVPIDQ